MKRNIFIFTFVFIVFSGCLCLKNILSYYSTQTFRRSLIGITGKDSSLPYIEIYYTKKQNDSTNEIVHEWVKPPYLIPEDSVNVSIYNYFPRPMHNKHQKGLAFNYEAGGDSYLKVINHSNHPIEMFVAVNFETMTYKSNSNSGLCAECISPPHLMRYPIPLYNKAPIYYLLFPNKTPNITNMNVLGNGGDGLCDCPIQNLSYIPTQVGDINISRPYMIDEIMSLYRAEYNYSKDTILYISYNPQSRLVTYRGYVYGDGSVGEYEVGNTYNPSNMYGFYKKINGLDSFVSANEKWYPMTNANNSLIN